MAEKPMMAVSLARISGLDHGQLEAMLQHLPFDVQQLMLIFWYFLRMIGSYSLRLQVYQPLTADQDPLPLEHQEVLPILAP